jgi:hypothetical protein
MLMQLSHQRKPRDRTQVGGRSNTPHLLGLLQTLVPNKHNRLWTCCLLPTAGLAHTLLRVGKAALLCAACCRRCSLQVHDQFHFQTYSPMRPVTLWQAKRHQQCNARPLLVCVGALERCHRPHFCTLNARQLDKSFHFCHDLETGPSNESMLHQLPYHVHALQLSKSS